MFQVEKLEAIDVIVPVVTGDVAELVTKIDDYSCNIILDFRNSVELNDDDLDAIEQIANNRYEIEKSVALCNVTGLNKSYIESRFDDLIVVPTLNEAVDFVYMEEQERDLGL